MTTLERPVPAVVRAAVPRQRSRRRAATRVALPGRTFLLVAGMPGAGKSTLLARLPARPGVLVLDSDSRRAALARRLPGVPYRRYRPLVHLLHRVALVRALCSATPTVVVHLPSTAASTRWGLALLARLTGRAPHLLWVHADPGQARGGQRERGRVVPSASVARHARRGVATHRRLRDGRRDGFDTVTVLDRAAAGAGLVLDTRTAK